MTVCTEAAPIKYDGRESACLLTLSIKESVGLPADSLSAHFIGAASGVGEGGGGGGTQKADERKKGCVIVAVTKGEEGVQKSGNFADVV